MEGEHIVIPIIQRYVKSVGLWNWKNQWPKEKPLLFSGLTHTSETQPSLRTSSILGLSDESGVICRWATGQSLSWIIPSPLVLNTSTLRSKYLWIHHESVVSGECLILGERGWTKQFGASARLRCFQCGQPFFQKKCLLIHWTAPQQTHQPPNISVAQHVSGTTQHKPLIAMTILMKYRLVSKKIYKNLWIYCSLYQKWFAVKSPI